MHAAAVLVRCCLVAGLYFDVSSFGPMFFFSSCEPLFLGQKHVRATHAPFLFFFPTRKLTGTHLSHPIRVWVSYAVLRMGFGACVLSFSFSVFLLSLSLTFFFIPPVLPVSHKSACPEPATAMHDSGPCFLQVFSHLLLHLTIETNYHLSCNPMTTRNAFTELSAPETRTAIFPMSLKHKLRPANSVSCFCNSLDAQR